MAAGAAAPFSPRDLGSKLTAWLRLQDGTQVSSEYSSVPDEIQANPAVANAARRPAAALSTNGLPIATFATNDCLSWPLGTGNNGLQQRGFACWVRLAGTGSCMIWSISNGTAGASAKQTQLICSGGAIGFNNYVTGTAGRQGAGGTLPAAGTWFFLRTMYDSSQSTEATKAKVYVNGALQTLSFGNLGAGGTLGTLPSVTGNILIGNINDGVASSPLNGDMKDLFVLNADLTAAEEAQLMAFEAPS